MGEAIDFLSRMRDNIETTCIAIVAEREKSEKVFWLAWECSNNEITGLSRLGGLCWPVGLYLNVLNRFSRRKVERLFVSLNGCFTIQ